LRRRWWDGERGGANFVVRLTEVARRRLYKARKAYENIYLLHRKYREIGLCFTRVFLSPPPNT
jgi:hypothetical protein